MGLTWEHSLGSRLGGSIRREVRDWVSLTHSSVYKYQPKSYKTMHRHLLIMWVVLPRHVSKSRVRTKLGRVPPRQREREDLVYFETRHLTTETERVSRLGTLHPPPTFDRVRVHWVTGRHQLHYGTGRVSGQWNKQGNESENGRIRTWGSLIVIGPLGRSRRHEVHWTRFCFSTVSSSRWKRTSSQLGSLRSSERMGLKLRPFYTSLSSLC